MVLRSVLSGGGVHSSSSAGGGGGGGGEGGGGRGDLHNAAQNHSLRGTIGISSRAIVEFLGRFPCRSLRPLRPRCLYARLRWRQLPREHRLAVPVGKRRCCVLMRESFPPTQLFAVCTAPPYLQVHKLQSAERQGDGGQ